MADLQIFGKFMFGRRADPERIRRLIEAGYDIDRPSGPDRWTPLHYLLVPVRGEPNMDILRVFVEAAGDLSLPDRRGWTALHFAARGGHRPAIALLLEHGADPNAADGSGVTVLHRYVCEHGAASDDGVLDDLLDNGATVTEALRAYLEAVASPDLTAVRAKLGVA